MESLTTPDRMIRIAVDLVNTRTLEPEQLTSVAALEQFLLDHGEPIVTVGEADLAAVKEVRERLRPVFRAEPREAAQILNALLAEYAVRPYLSDHDGSPWHLHVARPDATWAEWLAAGAALGLSGFAAGHGFEAIDTCAAHDCERVFVNGAQRRPRRFCTPTCSSRSRVASYRARRSGGALGSPQDPRRTEESA
ncbi:CGNR zinc finger domain-containing protein [Kribbella sp. CA-293567]|uniref:CGNR zinc finger domain-containing protein n=1 Tax=Kribbella sp. CA-293567 TaxID=3002436 RepID=UPI0022DCFC9A|nr:CGNR zinc finger domain-containing protein [Kribbella sp. CA-293567]WBQ07003.1 CGNR zinc finger domain-containing protein [Kribbella sp. CA-293567]